MEVRGRAVNGDGSPATLKQLAVLEVIAVLWEENLRPPTYREIQSRLGSRSADAVKCHVVPLVATGVLVKAAGLARVFRVSGIEQELSLALCAAHVRRLGEIRLTAVEG